MSNVIENLKKYALLRGIIYIIFGIIILMNPNEVFKVGVYFISAYTAFNGLVNVYEGLKVKKQTGSYGMNFMGGIILLLLAGIILFFAKGIVSILPIFLGLMIVIGGVIKLMQALNLRGYVNINWVPYMIYSIILIVAGLTLTFNPFSSLLFLFQLFGGLLIFMGISEIISFFQLSKLER